MQKFLFALVQRVETDKDENLIITKDRLENVLGRFRLQPFRHSPVYHAFIRKALLLQKVVILTVKRIQQVPYL